MLKKLLSAGALAPLLMAGIAAAQTTSTSSATTSTTTVPGVPSTGVAGDAAVNAILLGLSLVIALGGALYLYMRSRARVSEMQ